MPAASIRRGPSDQLLPNILAVEGNRSTDLGSLLHYCEQDYPEFQLIRCQRSDDPAIGLVRKPRKVKRGRLLVCQRQVQSCWARWRNAARRPTRNLLVNDSDILVAPDYLRRVIVPLADSAIGMVTCLYVASRVPTLGSRLSLGSALILFRRAERDSLRRSAFRAGLDTGLPASDLLAIGGFEAMVITLRMITSSGVVSSRSEARRAQEVVVDTLSLHIRLDNSSITSCMGPQRQGAPWGTSACFNLWFATALLTLLAARGRRAWALLLTVAARLVVGLTTALEVLGDR